MFMKDFLPWKNIWCEGMDDTNALAKFNAKVLESWSLERIRKLEKLDSGVRGRVQERLRNHALQQ